MKNLGYDDVVSIHWALVDFFRNDDDSVDPPGVKDENLLHSAVQRPNTGISLGDNFVFKYNSVSEKAAALLHSLIKNHSFYNGNKRTALISAIRFLDVNKYSISSTDEEYFSLIVDIAKNEYPEGYKSNSDDEVRYISEWFNKRISKQQNILHNTTTKKFIENCESLGAKCEDSKDGMHFILRNGRKSTKVRKKHTSLQGAVQRNHLKALGFSRGQSGVRFEEFQNGADSSEDIIKRLIIVLRKLAAYDRSEENN